MISLTSFIKVYVIQILVQNSLLVNLDDLLAKNFYMNANLVKKSWN